MMDNLIKYITFSLFLFVASSSYGAESKFLIKEMEKLRNSLDLDDPARIDLTLRLADLYFDVSIKEGETEKQSREFQKNQRLKALDLYKHALNGTDGVKKAQGITRLKIEFQMARLLSRLEEFKKAENHYLNVHDSKIVPEKMKEQAALALAEWYEEDAKYIKSKRFYDSAIGLCKVKTSCNYIHYRMGWLYFKDNKLEEAIVEMKSSLWAEDNEIRESSLQDLIMFMSNADTDGKKELDFISEISKKINRPEIVRSLIEAFVVAGNRKASSNLIAFSNEQNPNIFFEARLLEDFYGFRNWDKVEYYLSALEKRNIKDIPSKKEEAKEVKKILRRFLVQIDAESEVIEILKPQLLRSIDIYLSIYPNDDLRKKLQQGWLKAQNDNKKKIIRLGLWISEDTKYGLKASDIRKLRQTRLSFAQKEKNSSVIVEEGLAIRDFLLPSPEADEFEYVAARELYEKTEYIKALPLFLNLVNRGIKDLKISKWTILSQNLSLDIFNKNKNYQEIIDQVNLWKTATVNSDNKEVQKENISMNKILTQAEFEKASVQTESKDSLQKFYDFCFSNVFPKKSCANAKVLAIKFSDQIKLISLLEKAKDENSLITEYELMGRFSDSAKLHEKLILSKRQNRKDHKAWLKTALLYELDGNFQNRDRVLKKLIKFIKKEKSVPSELEQMIFLTLDEAELIDSSSLFLPWSLKLKLKLATRIEAQSSNKYAKKLISKQETYQGPIWSKLLLTKVEREYPKASKTKFYGKHSKWLFKKRTKVIDRFAKIANSKLNAADVETRTYLLHMLGNTYSKMVKDIYATPLPSDLDAETMAQVKIQLQSLAAPYETARDDYQKLLQEQLDQVKLEDLKKFGLITSNLASSTKTYSQFIKISPFERSILTSDDIISTAPLKDKLLLNPLDKLALSNLVEIYKEKKSKRLMSYFKGRLGDLGEENEKK